jgi:hypothetical protein
MKKSQRENKKCYNLEYKPQRISCDNLVELILLKKLKNSGTYRINK